MEHIRRTEADDRLRVCVIVRDAHVLHLNVAPARDRERGPRVQDRGSGLRHGHVLFECGHA
eukprot:16866-Pelagococcus_subviridis.AAC.1